MVRDNDDRESSHTATAPGNLTIPVPYEIFSWWQYVVRTEQITTYSNGYDASRSVLHIVLLIISIWICMISEANSATLMKTLKSM